MTSFTVIRASIKVHTARNVSAGSSATATPRPGTSKTSPPVKFFCGQTNHFISEHIDGGSGRSSRGHLMIRMAKGGEEGGKAFGKDVYGTIAKNANYGLMGAAMTKANLEEVLTGEGPFTIFAANDDAMSDFCKEIGVTKLALMDLPNLADVMKGHMVQGSHASEDLTPGKEFTTMAGTTITIGDGPSVNGIAVIKKDIKVENGIIHALKSVVKP